MAIRFKDTISINEEYTFPLEDGTADQVLATDGAGNISFVNGGGESVKIECKNTSGSTITKGTPVYVTGTVGTSFRVQIAPADASDSAKMPAVGLLQTDLANNGEGYVVTGGLLKNLTTDPIDGTNTTSNDTIYVKAGGGLTMTKPTGSNLIQNIGKIGRVNSSNAGSVVVSSILRTNDVPNLTEGKIWVGSADNTIESTVVHIDETNTRIGINQNTPDVTLDITGTDAIQIPKGTDAERPTPESGMLRFNTTSAEFEGYNGTEWGAIGGSEVATVDIDSFTGDGTTVDYTLTSEIPDEKTTQVYIDGVYQSKSNYSVSGTTLTFSTAPPNGTAIEVVHFTSIAESTLNGSGTANYVTKWQDADTLANSIIFDNGTNIGIGTASPTNAKLEVNGEGLVGNGTNGIKLSYSNGNSTGILDTGYSSTGLEFRTGNVFRMELNSTGLGIGTNTPTKDLHISSTSGTKAMFERTGATGAYIGLKDSSGSLVYLGDNNGTFEVQTAGSSYSTKLAVTSAGNVGINQTSPNSLLTVGGNFTATTAKPTVSVSDMTNGGSLGIRGLSPILAFDKTSTGIPKILMDGGGLEFKDGTLDSEGSVHLKIDSSGNVGIGTTSPVSLFNVAKGSIGEYMRVGGDNASNQRALRFSASTTTSVGDTHTLNAASTNGVIAFATGGSERMRIDSSGNVTIGIGTTTPQKLEVRGIDSTAYSSTDDDAQRSNGATIAISNNNGTTNSFAQLVFDTAGTNQSIARIAAIRTGTSSNDMAFVVEGGNTKREALRITSSGNVGIGDASPADKLEINGLTTYPHIRLTASSNTSRYMRIGMVDAITHTIEANGSSANLQFVTGMHYPQNLEGSAASLGKPALADLNAGLSTAPVLFAAESHGDVLVPAMARKFKEAGDIDLALRCIQEADGVRRTKELAAVHAEMAMEAVVGALEPSPYRDSLVHLASRVIDRSR